MGGTFCMNRINQKDTCEQIDELCPQNGVKTTQFVFLHDFKIQNLYLNLLTNLQSLPF